MKVYLDTSALLRRYLNEKESEEVVRVMRESHAKVASGLVFVELASVFRRAVRGRQITPREHKVVTEAARQDLKYFRIFTGDEELFRQAAVVADLTGLKSLDSIHLACARMAGVDMIMTYDREMAAAAKAVGVPVWA
jgi:predicted nucleic acid-binding protein